LKSTSVSSPPEQPQNTARRLPAMGGFTRRPADFR
jgi:hypothetical protein